MRIGGVAFASNLFLCPIAGYCDLAYRRIVRSVGGVGLAYTDLVNPKGLARQSARSMQIVRTAADDQPLSIQLYGSDAEELAEGAAWAADHGSVVVDINMGCPVPKVAGKGGGSGLLRSCDAPLGIAETVVRRCPVPVTIKTRLGWEMGDLVAPRLARRFREAGIAALTIHGRYGEQKFSGSVDLEGIAAVVDSAGDMPVIGNGDVRSPEDARKMIQRTGCAGVMIGRRALADPWIFRDAAAYLSGQPVPDPPARRERTLLMVRHFENMIEELGERLAVTQFRKRMVHYSKTIGPCPTLRRRMPLIQSVDEFRSLVHAFLEEIAADGTAEEPWPRRFSVDGDRDAADVAEALV